MAIILEKPANFLSTLKRLAVHACVPFRRFCLLFFGLGIYPISYGPVLIQDIAVEYDARPV
jgi:hypothetical protein